MPVCLKAVILAAGRGTRLGALTDETPKCLLPIAGKPLLDHHLDTLSRAGVRDVTLVVGFEAERVIAQAAGRCRVVVNHEYASTNSIVSLHRAASHVRGGAFLFQNADVLYAPELVQRFVTAPPPNACLVDPLRPYTDREYQVALERGRIVEYSRAVGADRSVGQSAQLVKVCANDSAAFIDRLGDVVAAGGHTGFPLQAYDALMAGDGLWPVYTAGLPWWEVDTLPDYVRCEADHSPNAGNGAAPARVTLGTLGSFALHPRVPWRYAWVPSAARLGLRHPIRTGRQLPALRAGRLSIAGLDLQLNGERLLILALTEAERAGLEPFLLWGSLLGCVRDHGFIRNDKDIDLGVLDDDVPRIPAFREAMQARGFQIRIDRPGKLSVVHPGHPRLFIDLDVVHRRPDGWAIINIDSDPRRICEYVFAPPVFGGTRRARFSGHHAVRLPADPETFLEAVYGDWRTPQPGVHHLYGPLNVRIEMRNHGAACTPIHRDES
ncbi:MAG TPA: phosphocholine cytidylyltransferase family protein [Gemmatimonadaceae bacterium]|jgi:choline kinase